MICPTCNQTIETEPERVTNWLPVKIKGVEYSAVTWKSIKPRRFQFHTDGERYWAPAIPLLFVERID